MPDSSLPLVSVVIPVHNAAKTLERALNSVRAQSYHNIELLLVDDASTDDSLALMEAFSHPRKRILVNEKNRGECPTMNRAIMASQGKYVAFLDADDEWLAEKLARQVACIEANQRASFVSCNFVTINTLDGTRKAGWLPASRPPIGPDGWRTLLVYPWFHKSSILANRAKLQALEGYDENLRVAGDQDMFIRLALAGDVELVNEVLVNIYDTPDSLMKRHPTGESDVLVPLIRRHVDRLGERLSRSERRHILGARHGHAGRAACSAGYYRVGVLHLLSATILGDQPLSNILFMARAAPPVRHIVKWLRARPGWQVSSKAPGS